MAGRPKSRRKNSSLTASRAAAVSVPHFWNAQGRNAGFALYPAGVWTGAPVKNPGLGKQDAAERVASSFGNFRNQRDYDQTVKLLVAASDKRTVERILDSISADVTEKDVKWACTALGVSLTNPKLHPLRKPELPRGFESSPDQYRWKTSTEIQTILFALDQGWTPGKAKAWCRAHNFKCSAPDITANYIRIRQHDPDEYQKGRLRTITLSGGKGIKAVVGPPKHTTGRARTNAAAKAPTYDQARMAIFNTFLARSWKGSSPALKIPHVTSPNGKVRFWFKAQAVYVTDMTDEMYGARTGKHDYGDARTVSYDLDIRKYAPDAVVNWLIKQYPASH